jgi:2-polyprenyl-6-methoxyphenol hydroxylase-like FAD-dependent oxidoreductase
VGFPTPGITLRNGAGKYLGESRTGHALPDGTTSHTVKRPDLYRVLHEQASGRGIRVEYGKRLVAAEETGAGVRAVFADGSEAFGDVLIGCDGVHSTVRRIIDPAAPAPTYAGLITNGGYARGVRVDAEPGSYEMIFGRRAFFGYAAAPDGEVWWFANVPRRDEPARGEVEAISGDEWRRRLLELFADDSGPAIPLIQATPEMAAMSPIHAIPHLPTWHGGRMIVIGDAAHAPSPSSGQGASLSIEDAVVLAKCLRDLPSPQAAFARFEAARRPRVERIIKLAARINNSKAAGPVARVFRDAMLPMVLRMSANSRADRETYGYHIGWDAPMHPAA